MLWPYLGGGDFIEVVARRLSVFRRFSREPPVMSLFQVASGADLARRILLTPDFPQFPPPRAGSFCQPWTVTRYTNYYPIRVDLVSRQNRSREIDTLLEHVTDGGWR